jgi:hypothetical protein
MGIRETRKKLQRSVEYIAQNERREVALRELSLLRQTLDRQLDLLSEESKDATDTEASTSVAEAAREGFETLYEDPA